jgi:hypothetical protein
MNFLHAYFGSFSCVNAYIFKGLIGHKNPVATNYTVFGQCTFLVILAVFKVIKQNGHYAFTSEHVWNKEYYLLGYKAV